MSTPEKEPIPIPKDFKTWYLAESRKEPTTEAYKERKRRGQQLCFEVAYTEGYQDASEAAYRHLSSKPSPGLRVRASERLPDIGKEVFFEIKWANGETSKYGGHVDKATTGKLFWFSSQGNYPVEKYLDQIEWLEETPSVQPIVPHPKGYIPTGTELSGTHYADGCGTELIFNKQSIAFYCVKPSDIPCSVQCDLCKKHSDVQPIEGEQCEVICPDCGGDGKETCHNPDHGFIESMPGEIGRLGCPVCGHDAKHKVNRGKNKCETCAGAGHLAQSLAEAWAKENNYDDEFQKHTEATPIADKEVPEEAQRELEKIIFPIIKSEIEIVGKGRGTAVGHALAAEKVAIAMYRRVQKGMCHLSLEIEGYKKLVELKNAELRLARAKISTQAIQIAGLLASNKEWGERYAEVCQQRDQAHEIVVEVNQLARNGKIPDIWFIAKKSLEIVSLYSSPTPADNRLADHDREIKRQTIDSLYQKIVALGAGFEPAAREVFHQAMNAL